MQLGPDGPGWGTKLGSQLCLIPHVNDTLSLPAPYKSYSNREGTSVNQQPLGGWRWGVQRDTTRIPTSRFQGEKQRGGNLAAKGSRAVSGRTAVHWLV